MAPLPDLIPPFLKILSTNEEATGAINDPAIGANKVAGNPCSCFTVSVTPSINTLDFSSELHPYLHSK